MKHDYLKEGRSKQKQKTRDRILAVRTSLQDARATARRPLPVHDTPTPVGYRHGADLGPLVQTPYPVSRLLDDRPEVLAVGPHTSIQQSLGRVAGRLAWAMTVLSSILMAGAVVLAAVWVHVEIYRHADEITEEPRAHRILDSPDDTLAPED